VAGAFYPSEEDELKSMLKGFLGRKKTKRKTIGAIVPHAGYVYSGKTAATVYGSVKQDFETVVLLGLNHNALGVVNVSKEDWKTPMGTAKPDEDFIREIAKDSIITEEANMQAFEHSLEVQLPWLQYLFKGFRIAPISINPYYFDVKTCREVGERVAEAVKKLKRKVLLIASSDFTHYGSMYGYEPFKGEKILDKIKAMDMEVIGHIINLEPEDVIKTCEAKRLTICGYGAIAAMLFAAKKMGAKKAELIDYSTSYDVSKNKDAIVAYAGIGVF
jgi:hypothetical protein